MNTLLKGLKQETNYRLTENGAVALQSTLNAVYDMFAFGGAMRNRKDLDIILLFKKAYEENPIYALKCLFYLRDILQGQGERRIFRLCIRWLANEYPDSMRRNIKYIPDFGRWDDLYALVDTPLEKDVFLFMQTQFSLDLESEYPSLLAKWLKSENTSSKESRKLAKITRTYFGYDSKTYRKLLSRLRKRLNILERLMSANRWEEIEFNKIPSKAGLAYMQAFIRHDFNRYKDFITNKNVKLNAKTIYPYECVKKAVDFYGEDVEREAINKFWDNLTNYFNEKELNALAVVDTSGSMDGTPIHVAISLGMYCAEKAKGPFANHYISFASRPQLIEVEGVDFVDKVDRIYKTNLVDNTNLQAVFNLLLKTAIKNKCNQEDLPEKIIIISDMEIDEATETTEGNIATTMSRIYKKWEEAGYKMPDLVYWNVDARNNIILDENENTTFVSGFSPTIFETIMSGKKGFDLCLEKLNSERYSMIK